MIKEYIAEGATVEAAMAAARLGLAAPDSADIRYDVIAQPAKKFLGLFGGSPAKVKAYCELPDPVEKKPAPIKKTNKTEQKKQVEKPESKQEKQEAKSVKEAVPAIASEAVKVADDDAVAAYIKKTILLMGLENVELTCVAEGKNITYNITCDGDQGLLIGRRGDTLDALQYLARLAANRNGKEYDRVTINVGNYREKREESLKTLAKRNASQVLKYGRNVSLEPMNPYERRIIHTAIQDIEGVRSFSIGADMSRRVVIALEDGVTPTHPSKGGYNNRSNRSKGGYNRGKGGRSNSRSAYTPDSSAERRAPRSDAAGSGLYGKIDVKKSASEE